MKYKIILVLLVLLLAPALTEAKESPDLPLSLYGRVYIFNQPATPGTNIEIRGEDGVRCGFANVAGSGRFGLLNCLSHNTTGDGRGAEEGEQLRAIVNNVPASILVNSSLSGLVPLGWESGTFKEIIIVRPPLVCGDGFCDNFESCATCPEDCGVCPPEDTEEGVPDDSIGDDFFFDDGILPPEPPIEEICIESWSCSDWGPCRPGGFQERECVDVNSCGTELEKPETRRACTYIEDEEERREEEPVERPPRIEDPIPIVFCPERMPLLSFPSLAFIGLILFTIIIKLGIYKFNTRRINKNTRLDEVEVLKKKYTNKKRTINFVTSTVLLSIIVYVYHYFFFMCPDLYMQHLWLLVLFLLFSPMLIYFILTLFKFNSRQYKRNLALLDNTYYKHILRLVKIVNDQLIESEKYISDSLKEIEENPEIKEKIQQVDSFKKIYKDINKLYYKYKENKPAVNVEKDLLENINNVLEDKQFEKTAKEEDSLTKLRNNLQTLYKSYEYKQELYDEMLKIEREHMINIETNYEGGETEEEKEADTSEPEIKEDSDGEKKKDDREG